MKYILTLGILLLAACNIDETEIQKSPSADFASVIEYAPAPGQFINDTKLAGFGSETTPPAACAYAERRLRARNYVSLGAWGGTLTVRFATMVANDGGYNLLIEGNSISSSSEPGVVWVMRDENGNGKPDDEWYELTGSESTNSIHGYEVTYHRPANSTDVVAWSDNQGGDGTIDRTVEHTQSYYPAWIAADNYTIRGTLLPKNVEQIDGLWIAKRFEWGYTDNFSNTARNLFRISDAVDVEGKSVSMPGIDFVKIQSGVMDKGPLIGEVSTEVCRICNYNLLK